MKSVDSAKRRAEAIFDESPLPKTNSSQSEEVKRIEGSGHDSGASSQIERLQNSDDEANC